MSCYSETSQLIHLTPVITKRPFFLAVVDHSGLEETAVELPGLFDVETAATPSFSHQLKKL